MPLQDEEGAKGPHAVSRAGREQFLSCCLHPGTGAREAGTFLIHTDAASHTLSNQLFL